MGKKWDDAKPAEKILALYSLLLFERREVSLTELSRELNCSKQAAGRLLNQIEASRFGKLIRERRGRESVFKMDRPSRLPQLCLDAGGLQELALCRDFVLHLLPGDMRKRIDVTLQQASAYAANGDGDENKRLPAKIFTKGHIDYTPFQGMLDTLLRAIREHKVCIVRYQSRRNKPPREFEYAPKRLDIMHESMFVSGWIVTERGRAESKFDEPSTLAVQRFVEVALTRRGSGHLPQIPVRDDDGLGMIDSEPFRVTLLINESAATYAAERQWSPDQTITDLEDDSIRLEITAKGKHEAISWILSFGDAAEVLSPQWLRDEVAEKIANLHEVYSENTKRRCHGKI